MIKKICYSKLTLGTSVVEMVKKVPWHTTGSHLDLGLNHTTGPWNPLQPSKVPSFNIT